MANLRIARRSGLVMRGGRQRRESLWLSGVTVSTALAAGSTAVLQGSLNAAALALRPFTIVRTRGYMYLRSDQAANTEFWDVAYGNIIVTDQAVAIGVTAVPTPVTEDASDWHVYERLIGTIRVISAIGTQTYEGVGKDIDSKAMRKVDLGEDLIIVVESGALTDGASVAAYSRTLIKLH